MDLVYAELHRIAAVEMRRQRGPHTLQTTAVLHEAYLRMCRSEPIDWQDSRHFYAVAALQLRRVLVDHARRTHSEKRGGGYEKVSLLDSDTGVVDLDDRLLALDEALTKLESFDARAARIVELRFFGGLSEVGSRRSSGHFRADAEARLGLRQDLAYRPVLLRSSEGAKRREHVAFTRSP